jgi:hypothetical protein
MTNTQISGNVNIDHVAICIQRAAIAQSVSWSRHFPAPPKHLKAASKQVPCEDFSL